MSFYIDKIGTKSAHYSRRATMENMEVEIKAMEKLEGSIEWFGAFVRIIKSNRGIYSCQIKLRWEDYPSSFEE